MEYLREDVAEKEEETKPATSRIGTIVVEESSEKTSTQDVEVNQPFEGWSEQERKVNWVDWIKTIGKQSNIVFIIHHLTIGC